MSYAVTGNVMIRNQTAKGNSARWGEDPIGTAVEAGYVEVMNILLVLVVLLLLFGGGGFYFGGPVIGGSGIGLILLICLVIYFAGGFRGSRN
jgi:hypothetical protein